METVKEIWGGDLFERRAEAEDLIGYLESVAGRPQVREDGHAHVLAVDAPYGLGKTFFLKRLARHLRLEEHAVAYVDAWADDLADEPMVALAATLDDALEPWVLRAPKLAERQAEFRARAGRVAKIVSIGLAKRAASFVIMSSGAEALGDALTSAGETIEDYARDAVKDASGEAVDAVVAGFGEAKAQSMETRIARFRDGQRAIADMKAGLGQIVQALAEAGMKLPITIVIDELDRCRPTYAIKLLEEVKHLFDVPGVAFVLGMHGRQLAHSVNSAYGTGFDSQAYLRRFFNRRYLLRDVELGPLLRHLGEQLNIPLTLLRSPPVTEVGSTIRGAAIHPVDLIAKYMAAYGLTARDAFQVMEMFQTAFALTGMSPLAAPLIIPMIIASILDIPPHDLQKKDSATWAYVYEKPGSSGASSLERAEFEPLFKSLVNLSQVSDQELRQQINSGGGGLSVDIVAEFRYAISDPERLDSSYANPRNYGQLLTTIKRFKSAAARSNDTSTDRATLQG